MEDSHAAMSRVAEYLEAEISVSGPIAIEANKCRLVALVGPTGVGKTTTVAFSIGHSAALVQKRKNQPPLESPPDQLPGATI